MQLNHSLELPPPSPPRLKPLPKKLEPNSRLSTPGVPDCSASDPTAAADVAVVIVQSTRSSNAAAARRLWSILGFGQLLQQREGGKGKGSDMVSSDDSKHHARGVNGNCGFKAVSEQLDRLLLLVLFVVGSRAVGMV